MAVAGVSADVRATDGRRARELLQALTAGRRRRSALARPRPALGREKFLPVTRHALLDRLTAANLWPDGDAVQARRFLRYLDYWRRHSYAVKLLELEQTYEPFSPDSDLLQDAHLQRRGARGHAEAARCSRWPSCWSRPTSRASIRPTCTSS